MGILSCALQCISFFQLGDGQSCLLFDVATSDIVKKKNKWWAWTAWPNALESRISLQNALLLLILRMKALTFTAFSFPDFDDPLKVTMPWVYPSHFVHTGGLLLELRSEYWEHPVVFSARYHSALWMLLPKIHIFGSFLLLFLYIFNLLVIFFKHSWSFWWSGNTSARLSAHGQTNGALFSVSLLTSILQSWLTVLSFLLPSFQVSH